ncbi:ComEC/Rec2 family competence protein [Planctomicrobium piriforme]|uniref:Competence protein ComEC n=1 Tax=Planctomicrobium piriforme TaxID=1576369 RepID=A0A1I3TBF7_9PLAN|nr:ComEC/Rec2 family competence protein [Planctomicrobium piriforme]SFJ68285.1 competence protein ComEC [Planctomicrobium piriforme]
MDDGSNQQASVLSRPAPRRPAVTAAILLGAGIAIDRWLGFPVWIWLAFAGIGIIAALFTSRFPAPRWASLCVLLAVFATGGLRQHMAWSETDSSTLAKWSNTIPQTVRVIGVISTAIEILDRPVGPRIPPWLEMDRSVCKLRCEQLQVDGTWQTVTGQARLEVTGHLVDVHVGDRVEVLGQLSRPGPPRNPGEFDYGDWLRTQGLSCQLRIEHPQAVQRIGSVRGLTWTLARWRTAIRKECQQRLAAELKPPLRGLAASLLLGDRTQLTDELKEQFAESGMMHLLAISGMNVGILLGMIFVMGRLMNLSSRQLAMTLIVTAILFTWITDHQASVIRAGLLAVLALIGGLSHRRVDGWNTLAACAVILLLWHPSDLFDIGAQLSFLAVAAIYWAARLPWRQIWPQPTGLEAEVSPWMQRVRGWLKLAVETYVVTGAIWLATLPLTMATFHLVTPIGLLLDLLLVPLSTLVLGLGYLFLCVSLLAPWLGWLIAIPFGWSLGLMQSAVAWGQRVPLGHFFVPAMPGWWLGGFYILLGLTWLRPAKSSSMRWEFRVWPAWIILGLLLPFVPSTAQDFRCTFLSVGHGLACVIELPTGETVIYDGGTLGDGRRAERALENLLWSRGIREVDTVLLSHADHDHYSGLFGLFDRFPVRQFCLAAPCAGSGQSGVEELCELAAKRGAKLHLLQQDDSLLPIRKDSPPVTIQVLHPREAIDGESDNAHSLVLSMTYAGRTILLTGDLEESGLDALLARPPLHVDVLLSPHHGGKASNVPALFRWASPDYVVVSGGEESLPHLEKAAKASTLLNTATAGAITFVIHSDGQITVGKFLP